MGLKGRSYRPKPPDEIARNMAAIRSAENKVEVALRKKLHALGLRYRKYYGQLPGRPDIVFPKQKVAVFVDGDYWHARVLVEDGLPALKARLKTRKRDYWLAKFQRRVVRDREVTEALKRSGWRVLRFWEGDIKKNVAPAAKRIARAVRQRQRSRRQQCGRQLLAR